MARWKWPFQSIGFAMQADANTENTTDADFHYFVGELEIPETTQQIFDIAGKTGQVGASYAPAVGAKRATAKLKLPLFGVKRSFDPTIAEVGVTDAVISAVQVLSGLTLGSKSETPTTAAELRKGFGLARANLSASFAATYANNEVAAVPSTTSIEVQAGHGNRFYAGQLFACGSSTSDTAETLTWIKSIAVDTLTFADAAGNQPEVNDDIWGSVVAYQSSAAPAPFSLRILGDGATFKQVLIGCTVVKANIVGKAGEPPMIEFEISAIDAKVYDTGGGLQSLSVSPSLPYPLVGTGAGRLTWGEAGAAMAPLCGVHELKIEIENKFADIPCHNKSSGISERVFTDRSIKVTMQIPRSSADTISNGNGPWQNGLSDGRTYQLAVYGGVLPGTLFSIFCPSLHQFAPPKMVEVEGLVYDELTFRCGVYVGDSGTGDAKNSNFRVGWA
jgi:hypothetical protein